MNTDITAAAVQNLSAQLGEALFGQPGMDLIEIANRCNAEASRAGGALLTATGKQQVGEARGEELTGLQRYRMAYSAASGEMGLHKDDTGNYVKLSDVERILAARQPVGDEWRDLAMQVERALGWRDGLRDKELDELLESAMQLLNNSQPVGQSVYAPHPSGDGCVVRCGSSVRLTVDEIVSAMNAAPPAQAGDLRQFRPAVELMEWQERGHNHPDFPSGDPKKHAEAMRLLALIDSQTGVGNG